MSRYKNLEIRTCSALVNIDQLQDVVTFRLLFAVVFYSGELHQGI